MTRCLQMVLSICLLLVCAESARAHYLWVVVDEGATGDNQMANVYFEESPSPGDGHYMDHFLGTSDLWVRTLEDPAPKALKAVEIKKKDQRWMQLPFPKSESTNESRSVDAYGKFGVYEYGKTKVLLHYYARNFQASSHEAFHELGRAEQLNCDLVPHDKGQKIEVKLLWKGKPVADRMVFVRGPDKFRQNVKTNKRGRITITPKKKGKYTFRSSVEEPLPGEEKGESYELIRHNVTLLMQLPLED